MEDWINIKKKYQRQSDFANCDDRQEFCRSRAADYSRMPQCLSGARLFQPLDPKLALSIQYIRIS